MLHINSNLNKMDSHPVDNDAVAIMLVFTILTLYYKQLHVDYTGGND